MMKISHTSKISAFLAFGALSGSSLSAQFLEANAQEAQSYAGIIDQGSVALSSASKFAVSTLKNKSGFTAAVSYDDYDADSDGGDRGFETEIEQTSAQIGYVHNLEPLSAGLSLTFLDTELNGDFSNGGNVGEVESDGDGWIFSLGAAYELEEFDLFVAGGVGSISQDSTRGSLSAPVGESDASPDTDLVFFTVGADFDFEISETLGLSPFVQLTYQDVSVDGFSEDPGSADTGNVDDIDRDWITGEIGVRSVFEISESLIATATLSYLYDFDNDDVEVTGQDVGALDVPGSIDVASVGESQFKAALEVAYVINEQWAVAAGLDASTGDDVDTFGAGLLLNFSF